ncbi:hypothetical protein [Aquicella lusitana]|uniref:CHAP domain-containing protein n=1 Tax=Aquicella lusitana TaxID=254246 RepID=A0A370GMM6_9COXI|nr:hypothetical protein [Aquicella lusitana]RDI44539.1 hypothetical protein C8D86_10921 [Aquicella lusitana]VVC72519.1 hypothetical protein AQULUS_02310 [Aquicella lusitana]
MSIFITRQFKRLSLIVIALMCLQPAAYAATTKQVSASQQIHNKSTKPLSHAKNKSHVARKKATHHASKKKSVSKKAKRKPHKKSGRPAIVANRRAAFVHPAHLEQSSSKGFFSSIEQRLISFVHNTVSTLRYSVYKLGGRRFDTSRGIYIVDCSSYVDRILQAVYPQAYSSLVDWSGSEKPTSYDYYNFFTTLSNKPQQYWTKVDDVEQLRPGDILVFRYKNAVGDETGGHVMVVMDKPIPDEDAFHIRVADSAYTGHSEDTRQARVSGIGIGTMLLKVNPDTYQPAAYAWKIGSRWKNNAYFAMARPMEASRYQS